MGRAEGVDSSPGAETRNMMKFGSKTSSGRQFEVWCSTCRVTFPPESKRCLHCGGRTTVGRIAVPDVVTGDAFAFQMPSFGEASSNASPSPPMPPEEFTGEEQPAGRSFLRAGMSVIWMVVLGAGYLWQSCTGGG